MTTVTYFSALWFDGRGQVLAALWRDREGTWSFYFRGDRVGRIHERVSEWGARHMVQTFTTGLGMVDCSQLVAGGGDPRGGR